MLRGRTRRSGTRRSNAVSIPTASETIRAGWLGDEPPVAFRDSAELRLLVGIYELLRLLAQAGGGEPATAGCPPTRATDWPTEPPLVTPPGKGAQPRRRRKSAQ